MNEFDPSRERPAILFANEAFYRAFADRDFPAMSDLWAETAACVCIHPGWPALTGRREVLASWERILAGDTPAIDCRLPELHFAGETAFVVGYEVVGRDWLVATNAFVRERGRWRMVFHQAGPAPPMAARAAKEGSGESGQGRPN
ncbi:MAG: nuclear transport factor 2 family protein [Rhodospirillales bacterium]|nr:nuclear transport factor 2 family protein [Rhodospirillales bacterium]